MTNKVLWTLWAFILLTGHVLGQGADPIRIKSFATKTNVATNDPDLNGNDGAVKRPALIQFFPGKKHQKAATLSEVTMGDGKGDKVRIGYGIRIDTSGSSVTHADQLSLFDITVAFPVGTLRMYRDSIVQYKNKGKYMNIGKIEIEVPEIPDGNPEVAPTGIVFAKADSVTLNMFPVRQKLATLTFQDTLVRTSGFAVVRTRGGKGFSRLGISNESLIRLFSNYQIWGETKAGTRIQFDYELGKYDNNLLLVDANRLAFYQEGKSDGPVFVHIAKRDPKTAAVRDTVEEFKCFYLLVRPNPGPWMIDIKNLAISRNDSDKTVLIEIPKSLLPDLRGLDWKLYATLYNGDSDIGHPHDLEEVKDRGVYIAKFSDMDIFKDENQWFLHGNHDSEMMKFQTLTVRADDCNGL